MITVVAGLSYGWGMADQSLETYYLATVRSMGSNWHDFLYGAFDPAGTVSVDKLPGALWIQALSVRLFGYHQWAVVLPQVVEGALAVLFLYHAVRRLAGPMAAITAAAVLAVTPATVALNRGNVSDSLFILLLVVAVDALVTAMVREDARWLLVAGLMVGLAFQAKMLEAWLILPVLLAGWTLVAPGPRRRRLLQVGAAGLVAVVVSLSWMSVVSLVPHADRPYVDGSTHDSLYQQVFVYNGLSRTRSGQLGNPLPGSPASQASLAAFRLGTAPGPTRLLHGAGGRDIGWLIPAALASGVAAIVGRRGRPRKDPLRAAAVVWGTWLVVTLVAISTIAVVNLYYTAVLAPAIAALCGIGVEMVRRAGVGNRPVAAGFLAVVACSVLYGLLLSGPAATSLKIRLAIVAMMLLAVATVLLLQRSSGDAGDAGGRRPRQQKVRVAAACVCAAALLFPLAASLEMVQDGLGPFDAPYQSSAATSATDVRPSEVVADLAPAVGSLVRSNGSHRYVAAVYSSIAAAYLIAAGGGGEFEPIGGYSGSIPAPTLGELQHQIDTGQLRTVIAFDVDDPRLEWVRSHCTPVPTNGGNDQVQSYLAGTSVYRCAPPG